MTDEWDTVLNIEDEFYRQGEQEADADAIGKIDEGKQLGFMKGFCIGLEIGYIQHVITNDDTFKKSIYANKRLLKLMEDIAEVPEKNDQSFDFKNKLDIIRSNYVSGTSSAGPLLRQKQTSSEW
jgi:hypothetical protein